MKPREVIFAPEAEDDLSAIHAWISSQAGTAVAANYLDRLERFCLNLDMASERGTLRDDVRPGLRVIGFERRIAIAFVAEDHRVVILRLFSGGQDWEAQV